MAYEIRSELLEMGFDVDDVSFELPELKIIAKRFRKLAKQTHSDKTKSDDDNDFVRLMKSYQSILKFFEHKKDCDLVKLDEEEEIITNLFKDFNFTKKNKSSCTVMIENELSLIWNEILENKYGKADDKGPQGMHWTHRDYMFDEQNCTDIFLRKYHAPKKDNQSKIHVQSNVRGNFLPAHFVDNVLPKIAEEVHAVGKNAPISAPSTEAPQKKEVKTKQNTSKCKECDFDGKNANGVKTNS